MYPTPRGGRILLDAERRLYEESLGMMVDHLSIIDCDFGVPAFDELQRGAKLFALYQSSRALLQPDEPLPERVAYLDAAVAAVYQHAHDMIIQEIDEPEFATSPSRWRELVRKAAKGSDNIDQVPKETSLDKSEWELILGSTFHGQNGFVGQLTRVIIVQRDWNRDRRCQPGTPDPGPRQKTSALDRCGIPVCCWSVVVRSLAPHWRGTPLSGFLHVVCVATFFRSVESLMVGIGCFFDRERLVGRW